MKLIQTKDYLLLIDEEAEIKPDDYIIYDTVEGVIEANDEWHYRGEKDDYWNKVIAYYPLTKEAKELDLPLLPPFEEVDIEKVAKINSEYLADWQDKKFYITSFIEGYKAAQSKQLELLKRAIQLASDAENIEEVEIEIIQSLSTQQLPKEFIPEYNLMNKGYDKSEDYPYQECKVLKTTINLSEKIELVGTYKY